MILNHVSCSRTPSDRSWSRMKLTVALLMAVVVVFLTTVEAENEYIHLPGKNCEEAPPCPDGRTCVMAPPHCNTGTCGTEPVPSCLPKNLWTREPEERSTLWPQLCYIFTLFVINKKSWGRKIIVVPYKCKSDPARKCFAQVPCASQFSRCFIQEDPLSVGLRSGVCASARVSAQRKQGGHDGRSVIQTKSNQGFNYKAGRPAMRRFAVSSASKVTSERFDYQTHLRTRRTVRSQLI